MRGTWVYILASKRNGTLYVGVTSDLRRRMEEHKQGLIEGFTKKYGVKRLVWVERHESIAAAIQREKTIKKYPRRWKLNLIERLNPQWRDLSETWDVRVRQGMRFWSAGILGTGPRTGKPGNGVGDAVRETTFRII